MDDIRDTIFEDINEEYAYGLYGNLRVIMMKKNGYINATKVCHDATTRTGTNKEFFDWTRNASGKGLIAT